MYTTRCREAEGPDETGRVTSGSDLLFHWGTRNGGHIRVARRVTSTPIHNELSNTFSVVREKKNIFIQFELIYIYIQIKAILFCSSIIRHKHRPVSTGTQSKPREHQYRRWHGTMTHTVYSPKIVCEHGEKTSRSPGTRLRDRHETPKRRNTESHGNATPSGRRTVRRNNGENVCEARTTRRRHYSFADRSPRVYADQTSVVLFGRRSRVLIVRRRQRAAKPSRWSHWLTLRSCASARPAVASAAGCSATAGGPTHGRRIIIILLRWRRAAYHRVFTIIIYFITVQLEPYVVQRRASADSGRHAHSSSLATRPRLHRRAVCK